MRVSVKADYAVRAMLELAPGSKEEPIKVEQIAEAQEIPNRFLINILDELRQHSLVASMRGGEEGYWLARPADTITLAQIIRAVEGPLATVRGDRPEALVYSGPAEALQRVWLALRTNLRDVLEKVTVADVVDDKVPPQILALADRPREPT